VTINEAINLGKIFWGEASNAFTNGMLDRITFALSRPLRKPSKFVLINPKLCSFGDAVAIRHRRK
jgi:hypothetical protein